MESRRIGSLEVSVVGLGCNNFGWRLDEAASRSSTGCWPKGPEGPAGVPPARPVAPLPWVLARPGRLPARKEPQAGRVHSAPHPARPRGIRRPSPALRASAHT
jgi:hypothetical protein